MPPRRSFFCRVLFALLGLGGLCLVLLLGCSAAAPPAPQLLRVGVETDPQHLDPRYALMEYVTAARAVGAAPPYILLWHVLPNIAGPLTVQATFNLAGLIVAEAGLSFLGLGVQPPIPSWGAMLNEGRVFLLLAPHLTTLPGLAIMLAVLGCNLLGDSLRDALDPRGQALVRSQNHT